MNVFRVGRLANAALGGWLFVSALLLDRTPEQAANAAVIGALVAVLAVFALYRVPFIRFLNAPLAVWFLVSAWRTGGSAGTVVSDLIVGTLIFGFSVVPPDVDPADLRPLRARP